jgi:hypothetical protein
MAKASEQESDKFFRTLFVGDSGTGKTGALLSLIMAGYDIRMLDFDNGHETLVQLIKKHCPERLDQFDYIVLRDKYQSHPTQGIGLLGPATAYTKGIKFMNKWDDGSKPAEWGPNTVFVLDTLTSFGRAAFMWAKSLNPNSKDPRQWYGVAQESLKTFLDLVTSEEFQCHVIISSHLQLIEPENGPTKLQVTSVGKALGGDIPKVFNNLLYASKSGTGDNLKRVIETRPNPQLDVKTVAPWLVDKKLPLETGLATIFEAFLERTPA